MQQMAVHAALKAVLVCARLWAVQSPAATSVFEKDVLSPPRAATAWECYIEGTRGRVDVCDICLSKMLCYLSQAEARAWG